MPIKSLPSLADNLRSEASEQLISAGEEPNLRTCHEMCWFAKKGSKVPKYLYASHIQCFLWSWSMIPGEYQFNYIQVEHIYAHKCCTWNIIRTLVMYLKHVFFHNIQRFTAKVGSLRTNEIIIRQQEWCHKLKHKRTIKSSKPEFQMRKRKT